MAIKTETIVTRYEVVTVQHEQGVDRIRQKQKQLELQLKDWNDEAKRMEKVHAEAWKKVGLAIGGGTAAIIGLKAAFSEFANHQRLVTAAAGVDIKRLQDAAGGLATKMELLEFAAKAQHGAMRLSTDQMVIAQKAIRQLVREGHDHEEVTKKVTNAIVKLNGGGLGDFGILIEKGKTEAEDFTRIMDALSEKAGKAEGATDNSAESIQKLGVRFVDAGDKIMQSLGKLVVSLEPVISAVARLTEGIADLFGGMLEGWGGLFSMLGGRENFLKFYGYEASDFDSSYAKTGDRLENYQAQGGSTADFITSSTTFRGSDSQAGLGGVGAKDDTFAVIAAYEEEQRKKNRGITLRGGAKKPAGMTEAEARAILGSAYIDYTDFGAGAGTGGSLGARADDTMRDEFGRALGVDPQAILSAKLTQNWNDRLRGPGPGLGDGIRGAQQSHLERMFGPLSQFNAYKQAFDTLSGAASSAMGAWIDGSASAGTAFKKFIGEALKGVASQMLVESLKHAAFALGSLAFGDFSGAARHGAAAAAFGSGAGVAAIAARELGGGGGGASHGASAGAGGGAGASVPTSYSAGGPGGASTLGAGSAPIIVVGSAFAYDSPRSQQRIARRLVQEAGLGGPGVSYG